MNRIYHPWVKWECYKSGFYDSMVPGRSSDEAKTAYRDFLKDLGLFEMALKRVIFEWKFSCEHFLSNSSINRIAWLGQASACIQLGLPSCFRGGFKLLSDKEQELANALAEKYLNLWLRWHETKN